MFTAAFIVVGLSARLVFASYTSGNFDATSYGIVVEVAERGGNVYAETARYNYSPVWFHLLLIANQVADVFSIPLIVAVRYFLAAVDVGNAALIGMIARSHKAMVVYLLSPVAMLVVGYHGQFDTLAALPLLLIIYYHGRGKLDALRLLLLCTLAILIKHNSVFAVWAMFVLLVPTTRAVLMMAIASALFLLSFVPYLPGGAQGIVDNVLLYDAINGTYGLSTILPTSAVKMVFWPLMLALPFVLKRLRVTPQDGVLVSFLAFLTLGPGIGVQYFILPALFGSLRPGRWHALFTGMTAPVIGAYYLFNIEAWNIAWAVLAAWLISHFAAMRPVLSHKEHHDTVISATFE